jgi:hypothetical protein
MTNTISQPTVEATATAAQSAAFNFVFVRYAQTSIEVGTINAEQTADANNGNNVTVTLAGNSQYFALDHDRIDNSNRGDYHIRAGGATNDATKGVFIATIASNGVDWGYGAGTEYGAVSIGYRADNSLFASLNNSEGAELNSDISAAYFDFTRYTGAWVRNDGASIISAGTGAGTIHVTKNEDYTYTITIDGVNSTEDGVLLVTGGDNKPIYATAHALADGSGWVVGVHGTGTNGYNYVDEDFGFTYVPKGNTDTVFGQVNSDGSSSIANGDYEITKIGTGEYKLVIDGYTPADGALVLSAEGLDGANIDNIVSYQPTEEGDGWIIQTRDMPSGELEDAGLTTNPESLTDGLLDDPGASYVGASVASIIASYENAVDGNVLIAAHRAGYYESGDTILAENSLAAVEHSINLGVDILEVDIRRTSDGHYVLMHDDSIDRTTTGSGYVSNLTLAEIRAANLVIGDSGEVTDQLVPTLEELFSAIDGKAMARRWSTSTRSRSRTLPRSPTSEKLPALPTS